MHSIACEKHTIRLDDFLLTEVLRTRTHSLPEKKKYLTTMSSLFYDPVSENELWLLAPKSALSALFLQLESTHI